MRYHLLFLILLIAITPISAQNDEKQWEQHNVDGYVPISYSHPALIDFVPGIDPRNGVYDIISGAEQGTLRHQMNLGNNSDFILDADEAGVFSDHYNRSSVSVIDYNDDGLDDLLVGDVAGKVYLYLNQGDNFSINSSLVQSVEAGTFAKPVAVDLNQDDTLDIVIGTAEGNLVPFVNQGSWDNPDFVRDDTLIGQDFLLGTHTVPYPIDPDGDGVFSFIVGSTEAGISILQASLNDNDEIEYEQIPYRNNNNPFLDLDLTSKFSHITPSMLDLDNNGFLDLIFGTESGEILIYLNLGYDFSAISLGISTTQVIIIVLIVATLSIAITGFVLRKFYQQKGQPLYLMIVQDIGIAPYQYEFTEELVQDKNLAGGALTGIQSLINEITSSDLNSMEAGDNRILISRHNFPSGMGNLQVLLWATADDPRLRELSQQLAVYVATTLEDYFSGGMFDETFSRVISAKIEDLYSDYI